jgi:hypothetical protein
MADDIIDGGAYRLRIAVVAKTGGDVAIVDRVPMDKRIDFFGGDAGFDKGTDIIDEPAVKGPGFPHSLNFFHRFRRELLHAGRWLAQPVTGCRVIKEVAPLILFSASAPAGIVTVDHSEKILYLDPSLRRRGFALKSAFSFF